MRLILTIPDTLLEQMEAVLPAGQSRAEWIREAIRMRLWRLSAAGGARKECDDG